MAASHSEDVLWLIWFTVVVDIVLQLINYAPYFHHRAGMSTNINQLLTCTRTMIPWWCYVRTLLVVESIHVNTHDCMSINRNNSRQNLRFLFQIHVHVRSTLKTPVRTHASSLWFRLWLHAAFKHWFASFLKCINDCHWLAHHFTALAPRRREVGQTLFDLNVNQKWCSRLNNWFLYLFCIFMH